MAMKFVVIISSLMVAMVIAQQRPVPPQFSRSGAGRGAAARLELEPQQTVPQPFRRVSLPLYRGRGFSLQDGQDPKSIPAITQLPPFQPRPAVDNNNNNNNNELNRVGDVDDETAVDALPQTVRSSQVPQQQVERTQQIQQFDRTQQQPEKQFNSFRPQQQIQTVETQPHYVRKVVQRPLKRPQVVEDSIVTSRSPETVQKLKLERLESADKQRAKKPVSQVLRRYRDDNPDGSITWGFENDDGTFKEETIGVDCVTRGKYGYVDPEGVKREYSYQSGIPCDKNRNALQQPAAEGSAVQEAQASDKSYGYIDYSKNQYVMANGQTINLNGMARNRARKQPVAVSRNKLQPVANAAGAAQPTTSPPQQLQRFGRAEQRRNNNNNNNNNNNYYY